MANKNPRLNKSGCSDPTAFKALYPTDESKRVSQFMDAVRALAALCGFEILNWVKIRVIRTGNEY